MLLVAAFLAFAQDPAQPSLPDLLSRVAEEAEILQQNAPKSLTQETLEQRALMPATRFRPRIGKAAAVAPPPRLVVRQIVSEYSVGPLKESAVPESHRTPPGHLRRRPESPKRRKRPPRPLPRHHLPGRPRPQAHARGFRPPRTGRHRHRLRHLPPRLQQTRPGEHESRHRRRGTGRRRRRLGAQLAADLPRRRHARIPRQPGLAPRPAGQTPRAQVRWPAAAHPILVASTPRKAT